MTGSFMVEFLAAAGGRRLGAVGGVDLAADFDLEMLEARAVFREEERVEDVAPCLAAHRLAWPCMESCLDPCHSWSRRHSLNHGRRWLSRTNPGCPSCAVPNRGMSLGLIP
jgi:hypothetical protein